MKTTIFGFTRLAAPIAALVLCTGATIWEGNASTAPAGHLPEEGYSVATNFLPRNTLVNIINLENNQSVQAIVTSDFEMPGRMALLSRSAANAIGFREDSVHRIRMISPPGAAASSHFQQEAEQETEPEPPPMFITGAPTLEPSEERIPRALEDTTDFFPPPEAPVTPALIEPVSVELVPVVPAFIAPAPAEPLPDFSPFQAPLVTRLEQGRYYVQVGAYRKVENVENEISRIGNFPIAIQNIGTDLEPLFRILLGPFGQNESTEVLHYFKSTRYSDAFIRLIK